MAEVAEESNQLIAAHRKTIESTQKTLDDTKELVSRLNSDIERQQVLLQAQRKELDDLLDSLGIKG